MSNPKDAIKVTVTEPGYQVVRETTIKYEKIPEKEEKAEEQKESNQPNNLGIILWIYGILAALLILMPFSPLSGSSIDSPVHSTPNTPTFYETPAVQP